MQIGLTNHGSTQHNDAMKLTASFALLSLAVFAFAGSLKSDIVANEAKMSAALSKGDMAKFKSLMQPKVTADFKYVEEGQEMTFDQMFTTMKQGFGQMKGVKATSKLQKLTEKGDSATGVTLRSMSWVQVGKDKKKHTMTYVGTTTDTYVKVNGDWKMSRMVWSDTKFTKDGKPAKPEEMMG